jgi:serine protease Do
MRGFEEVVERLRRSSVQIVNRGGGGSGIVWDSDGHIVTNAHVARTDEAWAVDSWGKRHRAKVVRRDSTRDLALLETNASLEPAVIGDSNAVRPGTIAIAIGNPLGIEGAVSTGVIHAARSGAWIEADVRLAPGNSGGMLADAEGRVIGVNAMICRGLGLAVPSNEAADFVQGRAHRLGVEMMPVREGLVIVAIEKNSLAERSDIKIGDILRCTVHELRAKVARGVDLPVIRAGRALIIPLLQKEARAA